MKRMPLLLGATGLGLALTTVSCTTLGTHVKGGFACHAPQGTCAPMSNIDAQAIAGLGAGDDRALPISGGGQDGEAHFLYAGAEGIPVRTGEHVMRVVFPAHSDSSGVYHEDAVAHVVSERSGWTLRPADAPVAGSLDAAIQAAAPNTGPVPAAPTRASTAGEVTRNAPLNLREAAAGLSAPAQAAPEPQEQVAADMAGPDSGAPSAAALAAARTGHRIGDDTSAPHAGAAHVRHVAGRHRHHRPAALVAQAQHRDNPTAALNRAVLAKLAPAHPHASDVAHAAPKQVASAGTVSVPGAERHP